MKGLIYPPGRDSVWVCVRVRVGKREGEEERNKEKRESPFCSLYYWTIERVCIIKLNVYIYLWYFVWPLIAAVSSSLLQARVHVCLDVPHFAAAWRVSFAIHVFGKQSQLAGKQNQAGYIVHSTRKYAFRHCVKRQLVPQLDTGFIVSSQHHRLKFSQASSFSAVQLV